MVARSASPANHEKEKGKFPKDCPSFNSSCSTQIWRRIPPLSSQKFYTLRLCCLAQIRIERSERELAAAGEFQIC